MRRPSDSQPLSGRPRRALWLAAGLAVLLTGSALGLSSAPQASNSAGAFRVFGSGELSCLRWLDDRRLGNESARQSEMWIAGYLTAYNQYVFKESDVSAQFEGDYLLNWVDDYCRKRGQNTLVIAAHELVQMLRRRH